MDTAKEKQHVHELIERLPPSQLTAVAGLLEAMLDPQAHTLSDAPWEDEAISQEEEQAAAAAREWRKHNPPIANEEVLAEFGLTAEDFERLGRTPLPPESR